MGIHPLRRGLLGSCTLRSAIAVAFGVATSAAVAGPIVLEESAKIVSPDSSYQFARLVAIDGDHAIVSGSRRVGFEGFQHDDSAWLFQRQSSGSWGLERKLVESVQEPSSISLDMTLDMRDGLAAIVDLGGYVFERTGSGWVGGPTSNVGGNYGDVEVEGGTIFGTEGSCRWDGEALRRNAAGDWVLVARVPGLFHGCDDEFVGDDGDISGTSMIVANLTDESGEPPQARIFEGPFGTTPTMTVIVPPLISNVQSLPRPVAIAGGSALVGATNSRRVYAYAKETSGAWASRGNLPNPAVINAGAASSAEMYGNLAVVGYPADPLRGTNGGSVGVFEKNSDGSYRYVARLVASDAAVGTALGGKVEISGRRIIASAANSAYVFDLPADLSQPETLQDDFEDGNANGWTTIPGSTFQVVASAGSQVYRQSSLLGDAGATVDASERRNQAIQADIRPTAFGGGTGERWFGLVARYTDPGNYYYVTLRNTNVVQLKRMHNGSFTTLAQKALPIPLNRTYRVRLEAIGTRLRVFVDNTFAVEARDTALSQGRAGIFMYKTSADFDNVVVTSDPHTRLVNDNFQDGLTLFWSFNGVGAWETTLEGSNRVLAQTSLAGDARALLEEPARDQIVQTRAKAVSFASGGERWFGLLARYRDEQNYYFLTVRNTNTVSLRMLVNGTAVVLDTATLPVALGQWYTLRLEAIGDRVRGYVNGNLLVEATDTTHESGRYGAMVFKTEARYDDFTSLQP